MRSCTTAQFRSLSLFSLLLLALLSLDIFGESTHPNVVGIAGGSGKASYSVKMDSESISLEDCRNDGFSQTAVRSGKAWIVSTEVNLDPLRVTGTLIMSKARVRALSSVDKDLRDELVRSLGASRPMDEAVILVLRAMAGRWNYVEKDDGGLTIEQLMASREASCLGMVRIAKHVLGLLDINSREVIGIKFPVDRKRFELKGGALHAWLEIEIEKGRWVFCDPRSTFGFVPEFFIVLKKGENFSKEEIQPFYGGAVELLSRQDRIFYDPLSSDKPGFWKRPSFDALVQGILLGKVLAENDMPVEGEVTLSSSQGSLRTELWNGNFYFKILSPGLYTMKVIPKPPKKPVSRQIELSDATRKKIVAYVEDSKVSP